jgi:hypothetical protein
MPDEISTWNLFIISRFDFYKSKKYEQPILSSHEFKFEPRSLQLGITEECICLVGPQQMLCHCGCCSKKCCIRFSCRPQISRGKQLSVIIISHLFRNIFLYPQIFRLIPSLSPTVQFSVLVELLPLSGVPNGSLVVSVSVLPQNLVNTKPRLCVRALLSDTKARDGRH